MKQTTQKTEKTQSYGINTVVDLTQETALATLRAAVQTQQVADQYVQNVAKSVFAANEAGLDIAKNYWTSLSQIQQSWFKLYADTAEKLITNPTKIELPFQKEVTEFGKDIVNRTQKAFESVTAQAK